MMIAVTPDGDILTIGQALQRANTLSQAGNLRDAARLYRAILQTQPNHPDANHNLGVLAVQERQPAAGLPHLKAALEANPGYGQYWISYIEALIQAGQTDAARQALAEGKRRGLRGKALDDFAKRLDGPSSDTINTLLTLFKQGSYAEGESLAKELTVRFPQNGIGWKAMGAMLKMQGKSAEAMDPIKKAVELLPRDYEAHSNLGVVLKEQGRLAEAESNYRRALELNPDYAEAHNNLGVVLKDQGRLAEAESSCRRALELNPDYAEAHCNLGVVLKEQGRINEAESSYHRALELKPDYAEAHNNLGNVFDDQGRLLEAESSYRHTLELKPDYAEAHSNLGVILKKQGRFREAESSCRRALELKPDLVEGLFNLGITLKEQGRLLEAESSYRRALEIKPDYAEAHSNLGNTLKEQGRLLEAESSYRHALEISPDFAEAFYNLGITLKEQGRLLEAESSYRRALEIKPDYAEAHSNLGVALKDQGRLLEAESSYRRALAIKPEDFQYAIQMHLLLPIIPESHEAIATWRIRYSKGIETLLNLSGSLNFSAKDCNPLSFYLAYHNQNDRPIMTGLNDLFRKKVPELTATAPHIRHWSPPMAADRRIRVGFLSEYLVEHTIGNLNQGFIRHLDRKRFEVVVIHSSRAKQDAFRRNLDAQADKVLTLPSGLKGQQQAVAAEKLDVLFYPDIGMSPATYFLAHARLAPVQAVTWGHPDTTGLDTMDYFISVSSFEPEGAEAHYTETLIRMNRLNCFYGAPEALEQLPPRAALGLPETGTLYGCPQSLFKFHPEFDAVLAAIAEGDSTGHIILLEGHYSTWTDLLKARWKKSYPVLLDRALFLPRMPRDRFIALQACMDVLLDPVHFGGGNTFYEAMVYGTPMVTFPGPFMRSRIASGGYRQMGLINAPVATELKEYAPLALALGRDPEHRRALRLASVEAAGRELFADMRAVREFEVFLEASVDAAGRAEKLPVGWRPEI